MLLPHAVIVAALTTSLATACSLCPMCFLEAVQPRPACIPAQTLLRSFRLANGSFPASVLARAGVCTRSRLDVQCRLNFLEKASSAPRARALPAIDLFFQIDVFVVVDSQ